MTAGNLLIDRPLGPEHFDSEPLGLSKYAQALGEFVEWCETPLTIGIQGDWGIGKTSLLNLLTQQLRGRRGRTRQYPSIYVNTWQHAQFCSEEFLGVSILNAVVNTIERDHGPFDGEQIGRLKEYGSKAFGFLANVANQAVKKQVGIDVSQAAQNSLSTPSATASFSELSDLVENYKSAFEEVVRKVIPQSDGSKLVVMIDDLDRVRPARALELLEAVKIFLDVPGCVFILAVDYSVIRQGVREKFGTDTESTYGKSYFDKIIQVPFNMPVAAYRMDRYVMSLLGWAFNADFQRFEKNKDHSQTRYFLTVTRLQYLPEEQSSFFTNIVRVTTGPNPRSVKRVVNYAFLLKTVYEKNRRAKEFDLQSAQILFALAAMQLEWPELFGVLAMKPVPQTISQLEKWEYLSSIPELGAMFKRASDLEQMKSNISAFFDEFLSVIDVNQDGAISADEFRPVWQIMIDTNLTSAPLLDNAQAWKELEARVAANGTSTAGIATETSRVLGLLRKSELNNPLHFRLIEAGKRFHNLVWDGRQFGSIATTQGEPLQFYLVPNLMEYENLDPEALRFMSTVDYGHYGVGDSRLDVIRLANSIDDTGFVDCINKIHKRTVKVVTDGSSKIEQGSVAGS